MCGAVSGEDFRIGVDIIFNHINGDSDFRESCGDEFNFSWVRSNITGGPDSGDIGFHGLVNLDLIFKELEFPIFDWTDICDKT